MRLGFDMDGVLADFARAYREVEERLYGPASVPSRPGDPEEQDEEDAVPRPEVPLHVVRRKRDVVWQTIQATPNFWMSLQPLEAGAVRRLHELAAQHRWEVFFITQRPDSEGETVQRQTQRWLVEQGFELPSVLVIHGSRGGAAAALRLDYHVDDSSRNCIDVKAESGAKPLLIVDPADQASIMSARRLGIGTAGSAAAALEILEQASLAVSQPTILHRLARLVGWH
jgi:hypothetical protein